MNDFDEIVGEEQNRPSIIKSIIGILVLIKFILFMRAIFLAKTRGLYPTLMDMGTTFSVFGLYYIADKYERENKIEDIIIFAVVALGLILAIISGIMLYGDNFFSADTMKYFSENLFPALGMLFFPVTGLLMATITPINFALKSRRCVDTVIGECVDLSKERLDSFDSRHNPYIYAPTYKVYYYNEWIYIKSDTSSNICYPKIGEKCEIKINPNDISEIITAQHIAMAKIVSLCGIFLLAVSFIIIPTAIERIMMF